MNKLQVSPENAETFRGWIAARGGIAVWSSIDLSDPGKTWNTPAQTKEGLPYFKPSWQAANEPERIITDPADVEVVEPREVKRFRVAVRLGAQGFKVKCTDASSAKIRREVEKAGDGAWHQFDYGTQEAVIYAPGKVTPLVEWLAPVEAAR